jgi:deazaflavin-dependent oxidoreductase (nitroreductase family)
MSASTPTRFGDLPYGPRLTRLLEPLYRGFGVANRYLALPLLRAGLGGLMSTPLTGSLMILRTRGRKTGVLRETPLGYAILDGSVWCCAGFGAQTQWYRNIVADPRVEVVLASGAAFAGTAEVVTEPALQSRGFRHLIRSLGVVGEWTVGDVSSASDEAIAAMGKGLPLIRIRPTGIAAGPADPGGRLWLMPVLVSAWWLLRRRTRPAHRAQ